MRRLVLPCLIATYLALGCESAPHGAGGADGGTGGDNVGGSGGAGGTGGLGSDCSVEPSYICVIQCGSDRFEDPVCEDDRWVCPPMNVMGEMVPTFPTTDCPDDICGGPPPFPGEICRDGTWVCEPPATAWAACPSTICVTCEGFPGGVVTRDGCSCSCDSTGHAVSCSAIDG